MAGGEAAASRKAEAVPPVAVVERRSRDAALLPTLRGAGVQVGVTERSLELLLEKGFGGRKGAA